MQTKLMQFNRFGSIMPKKFKTKIVGMYFNNFDSFSLKIGEKVFLKENPNFHQGLEVFTANNVKIGSIFEKVNENEFIYDEYFNNHRIFLYYKGYNFFVKEIHRNVIILDAIVK